MNPPKQEKASPLSASSPTKIIDLFLGYFIKSRAAVIREAELTFLPSLLKLSASFWTVQYRAEALKPYL